MEKLRKAFDRFEKVALSIPFIFLSFAIVANVILRKTVSYSFSWLEELSRYIFVFATFMGVSIAVSSDKHPKMTAIQTLVGPKFARYLILLSNVICFVLFIFVGCVSFVQIGNMINMGSRATSINMPLYMAYLIIPASMVGMVIRFGLLIIKDVKKLGKKEADSK